MITVVDLTPAHEHTVYHRHRRRQPKRRQGGEGGDVMWITSPLPAQKSISSRGSQMEVPVHLLGLLPQPQHVDKTCLSI